MSHLKAGVDTVLVRMNENGMLQAKSQLTGLETWIYLARWYEKYPGEKYK